MATINVLKTVLTASDDGFSKTFVQAATSARELNKMLKDGEAVYKATRTPLENYEAEVAKLNGLLRDGGIQQDTYNRAVASAGDAYHKANPSALTAAFGKMVPVFDPISLALRAVSAGFDLVKDAATAVADVLVNSVVSGIERLDALDDAAAKLGVTTEALSALRFAAGYADIEISKIDSGIGKMNVNINKATEGGKAAAEAFAKLGLDANVLKNAGTEKAFGMIADAIKAIPNQMERANRAADIFGSKIGKELLPILEQGAEGVKAFTDEGRELGKVISSVDAAQVAQAADAVKVLTDMWEGVGNTLAIEVAPIITAIADQLRELGGGNMTDNIKAYIDFAVKDLTILLNVLDRVNRAYNFDFSSGDLAGDKMFGAIEKARGEALEKAFAKVNAARGKGPVDSDETEAGGDGASHPVDDLQKRARELMDAMRTPVEKLQDTIMDIEGLFAAGAIDVNTFNKALEKAEADFAKLDDREQKKMDDEQKKRDDKWFEDLAKKFEEADKLREKLKTPQEKREDEIKKLNEMFAQGWIDQDTRDKGIDAANKTKHRKGENEIGAFEMGSKEAFSAINKARGGGAATGTAADIARRQLDVQRKQKEALDKLVAAGNRKPPVAQFGGF